MELKFFFPQNGAIGYAVEDNVLYLMHEEKKQIKANTDHVYFNEDTQQELERVWNDKLSVLIADGGNDA